MAANPFLDAVRLAIRERTLQTEAIIRSMLPIAGHADCPRCKGRGAWIENDIATPLVETVVRCNCVTISPPCEKSRGL